MMRRLRRPDDNRFLPKDAKLWRRLIKHVRYAVRAPLADTSQLYKAADACGRCVPPQGYGHRGSPFLAIVMQGRGFGRLSDAERQSLAAHMGGLADQCEAALNSPPPAAAPAARRDIFG